MIFQSWFFYLDNFSPNFTNFVSFLNNSFPFRSLSSRSVLLSNGDTKICDYGLAKLDTFEEFKSKTRWLAPESLKKKKLTRKADVFSFGVTVWEIATRKEPYSHVDSTTAMALIVQNYHLPIPAEAPSLLTEIMHGCWETNPKNRFSAQDIVQFFPSTGNSKPKKKTNTSRIFGKKLKNHVPELMKDQV